MLPGSLTELLGAQLDSNFLEIDDGRSEEFGGIMKSLVKQ